VDFLGLYIPSNPFFVLANNLVPAVVLFSIALGVALIGVPNKEKVLDGMGLLIDTLIRIANFVVKLTPLGVFAIMASSAGTMSFAEFQRLEVYIYSYVAISLVMSLWVLPALVTALTPLTYREVVGSTKDALITAFATTSLFVVLPILMEKSKEMVARHTGDREKPILLWKSLFPPPSIFHMPANCLHLPSFCLPGGTPAIPWIFPTTHGRWPLAWPACLPT